MNIIKPLEWGKYSEFGCCEVAKAMGFTYVIGYVIEWDEFLLRLKTLKESNILSGPEKGLSIDALKSLAQQHFNDEFSKHYIKHAEYSDFDKS